MRPVAVSLIEGNGVFAQGHVFSPGVTWARVALWCARDGVVDSTEPVTRGVSWVADGVLDTE
ncbi:hypothetical protein GCM10011410_20240 [Hoyosella rhizosphaerae]|uniref:Uncharacterized protein n=1 Tax=Hoyosella rhizosphaerae TaxID=1755582 RepID=A0A916XFU8_9ACTN|nr:hypothetical protein GCM10011410_20240 [Hoyosella rhizosphaerae]